MPSRSWRMLPGAKRPRPRQSSHLLVSYQGKQLVHAANVRRAPMSFTGNEQRCWWLATGLPDCLVTSAHSMRCIAACNKMCKAFCLHEPWGVSCTAFDYRHGCTNHVTSLLTLGTAPALLCWLRSCIAAVQWRFFWRLLFHQLSGARVDISDSLVSPALVHYVHLGCMGCRGTTASCYSSQSQFCNPDATHSFPRL